MTRACCHCRVCAPGHAVILGFVLKECLQWTGMLKRSTVGVGKTMVANWQTLKPKPAGLSSLPFYPEPADLSKAAVLSMACRFIQGLQFHLKLAISSMAAGPFIILVKSRACWPFVSLVWLRVAVILGCVLKALLVVKSTASG